MEENIEDLSSNILLEDESEIECLRGDVGFDNLVGDTVAESLGGESGGVSLGVLLWDANRRPCDAPYLKAVKI